jgi:hypothetical protein
MKIKRKFLTKLKGLEFGICLSVQRIHETENLDYGRVGATYHNLPKRRENRVIK